MRSLSKKLLILSALISWIAPVVAQERNTFNHRWNIEVCGFGVGVDKDSDPIIIFEEGFSHKIGDTRWRWGTNIGLILSPVEYWVEYDEIDSYLSTNYISLLGYADYVLCTSKNLTTFLHGGIAPCWQIDKWKYHQEEKLSLYAEYGIGLERKGYVRLSLGGYVDLDGNRGIMITTGFYVGKK